VSEEGGCIGEGGGWHWCHGDGLGQLMLTSEVECFVELC